MNFSPKISSFLLLIFFVNFFELTRGSEIPRNGQILKRNDGKICFILKISAHFCRCCIDRQNYKKNYKILCNKPPYSWNTTTALKKI